MTIQTDSRSAFGSTFQMRISTKQDSVFQTNALMQMTL